MMSKQDSLFRVVYVSRNRLPPGTSEAEVTDILAGSRRRNAARGVTGALLFCEDCFAQVLEGPLEQVTELFEAIQCDPRHDEVVVLEAVPVSERGFAAWSMAYGGHRRGPDVSFAELTGVDAGPRVLALLQGALRQLAPA